MKTSKFACAIFMSIFLLPLFLRAQTPGYIFVPATTNSVLDPNGDHYTSKTTAGFMGSDLTDSEISFWPIPAPFSEILSDLRRGSDGSITDAAPDANGNSVYVFFDGTNLVFRMRQGSYSPGVFGFSILIDADLKMGSTGTSADSNYLAQTTGNNGNPGFEYEIVLEKGSRVAVYNVNGPSPSPSLLSSYAEDHWQTSRCLTNAGGNADYFIDFYVPLSALNVAGMVVTTTTPLRMVATSCTSPAPAIGGAKSDIAGVNDDNYPIVEEAWTLVVNSQPGFTPTQVGSSGTGAGSLCTAPPAISAPIANGAASISGTWTATSSLTTATISVYKSPSTLLGTVAATSGAGWSYTLTTAAATGESYYAIAQAGGESACLQSNVVTVQSCTPSTTSATPLVSCFTNRGAQGTMTSGATVTIYQVTPTGIIPAPKGTTNLTYSGPNWSWNSTNSNAADPCSGSQPDVDNGTYFVTATETGKCESGASSFWCFGLTATAAPVITQTQLYSSSTVVSGTSPNPSTVWLFINGVPKASQTTTGTYSFTGLVLNIGDVVEVSAQASGQCMSALASRTVTCYTSAPVINADASGKIAAGSPISGVCSETSGTVTVYTAAGTQVATAAVQTNGSWATTYNAVNGTSYYAILTSGPCAPSGPSATVATLASNNRCPVITTPVNEGAASVSGTLASVSNTTVRLYQDGALIGSVVTSNTSWTINITAPIVLYAGGVLTATTQVIGTNVESSCTQNIAVQCVAPTAPLVSPTSITVCSGSTVSVGVSNSVSGVIYTLRNSTGTTDFSNSLLGTGSSISLTSYPLTSDQTLKVFANKPGATCSSSSANITATVNSVTGGTIASDQTIGYGGDPAAFTVSVAATGSGTPLTYQWQSSTTGPASGFGNISGATLATYDPPSGLTQTTWYKRIVTSTLNSVACTAESNVVKVTAPRVFLCNSPNNWNDPANWGNPTGSVPAATDDVYINCTVHVNSTGMVCNNLTIGASGSLVVDAGMDIKVNGTLTNSATVPASGVIIKSTSAGSGALYTNTAGVQATVESFISKYGTSSDRCYHFFSPPVSGVPISSYFNLSSATDDLYLYDETTNMWINAKSGTGTLNSEFQILNNNSPNFQLGKGYMIALAADATWTFTGTLNTADVAVNLTYTSGKGEGYNLIGNPFSTSLDPSFIQWNTTNVCGFYIWDCSVLNFRYVNGGVGNIDHISPEQGFFIHATAPIAGYTIPAAARIAGGGSIYKSVKEVQDVVRLSLTGPSYSDETFIRYSDDATDGFDCQYDMYKFGESPEVPYFYTEQGGDKLAINALPYSMLPGTVKLGLKLRTAGTYSINLEKSTLTASGGIVLEDTQEGTLTDLATKISYSFNSPATEYSSRFVLHLGMNTTAVRPVLPSAQDFMWYANHEITLRSTLTSADASIEIHDMTGRLITMVSASNVSGRQIPLRVAPGIYVAILRTDKSVISQKFLVY